MAALAVAAGKATGRGAATGLSTAFKVGTGALGKRGAGAAAVATGNGRCDSCGPLSCAS